MIRITALCSYIQGRNFYQPSCNYMLHLKSLPLIFLLFSGTLTHAQTGTGWDHHISTLLFGIHPTQNRAMLVARLSKVKQLRETVEVSRETPEGPTYAYFRFSFTKHPAFDISPDSASINVDTSATLPAFPGPVPKSDAYNTTIDMHFDFHTPAAMAAAYKKLCAYAVAEHKDIAEVQAAGEASPSQVDPLDGDAYRVFDNEDGGEVKRIEIRTQAIQPDGKITRPATKGTSNKVYRIYLTFSNSAY